MRFNQVFQIRIISLRLCALVLILLLAAFFTFSYFGNDTFEKKNVLGGKKTNGLDTRELIKEAADDLTSGNTAGAKAKIRSVLAFEPENSYALRMISDIDSNSSEIETEINRTLEILKKQSDWQEAWFRLSDLYERSGQLEMADYAREKAKVLKTT